VTELKKLKNLCGGQGFGVIYADPPWPFATRSARGRDRSPDRHYAQMTSSEIMALPVWEVAAPDCVLLMWVTMPQLPLGLWVMRSWGFEYKTCGFAWLKTNKDGALFKGLGFWTRANAELCLLGTRGNPKRLHADVPQAILAPRGRHSAKPAEIRRRIERLAPGPYLELFAREKAPGWISWGDQLPELKGMTTP
jgi:N6-adenosine-specific RNA methylase IME4